MPSIHAAHELNDPSVIHTRDTIGKLEDPCIVSDYDHGSTGTLRNFSYGRHHCVPSFVIKAARRLVANYQLRVMHQRASDCHPLLLASAIR